MGRNKNRPPAEGAVVGTMPVHGWDLQQLEKKGHTLTVRPLLDARTWNSENRKRMLSLRHTRISSSIDPDSYAVAIIYHVTFCSKI